LKYFNLDIRKCLELLKTDDINGLTQKEAKARLEKNGENKLEDEKKNARFLIDYDKDLKILGSDIDRKSILVARDNADILGVEDEISFFIKLINIATCLRLLKRYFRMLM